MASDSANLTCEHCGDTFLRKEHWDRHLRRHSGVKPFQCEVCSKSFARSQSIGLHVTHRQPLEAAEQSALYHNTNDPTSSPTSNSQGRFSFSPTVAMHSIPAPTTFTPSSLGNDTALHTSNQWDPSLSLHGDTVMNEFAAGWDPMAAYFPFWLVPEGLGDVLDTPYDMGNHNQQCGVETHNHPPDYHPPCRRFPQTHHNHMQTAEAEAFGHVQNVPLRAYGDLQNFYATQCQDSHDSD
ncbi:hypothetical protein COCVIDRAFT_41745 [Bipolaris victoriae FI3]|uniref:C2H2-type domain-containing protein n=1 Tax=Bipolaris victoriae (strain FI3) TaxID=930091 RepID=W7DWL4_BIPV3|nr:hypothetical protein COCVIDRAFT_41745 [Bipolaris victoriae FI3]